MDNRIAILPQVMILILLLHVKPLFYSKCRLRSSLMLNYAKPGKPAVLSYNDERMIDERNKDNLLGGKTYCEKENISSSRYV